MNNLTEQQEQQLNKFEKILTDVLNETDCSIFEAIELANQIMDNETLQP